MRSRNTSARWLLVITCLVMALCLIQRAVYLRQVLSGTPAVSHVTPSVSQNSAPAVTDNDTGAQPCQLSAWSLLCAQPLFFDGALPALLAFLVLIAVFSERRKETYQDKPVPIPLLKIHLKNCVFRE